MYWCTDVTQIVFHYIHLISRLNVSQLTAKRERWVLKAEGNRPLKDNHLWWPSTSYISWKCYILIEGDEWKCMSWSIWFPLFRFWLFTIYHHWFWSGWISQFYMLCIIAMEFSVQSNFLNEQWNCVLVWIHLISRQHNWMFLSNTPVAAILTFLTRFRWVVHWTVFF